MQKGETDNCSHCQFNRAQKNVPAYCDVHMVPLKFPRWTSCVHFISQSDPSPESPPAPQGQIFRAGLYEEKLTPLRPSEAPNQGYVRIPWYGKTEPKIYVTGNCNECKKNFSSGIEITTEKEVLKFCGNRHYVQWWKTKNPHSVLTWDYAWETNEDPIPMAEKIPLTDKEPSASPDSKASALPSDAFNEALEILLKDIPESTDSEVAIDEEPLVIGMTNDLLKNAQERNASEIHLEATSEEVLVRMKYQAQLHEVFRYPLSFHKTLVSRLKIIGNLDLAERRRPQQNHFQWQDHSYLIRTLPVLNGERVWIQLLPQSIKPLPIEELGFRPDRLERYKQILQEYKGLILYVGPRGCGKKTTIYETLEYCQHSSRSLLTVESTLKRKLKNGIQQSLITTQSPEKKLLFAACEQRPDVLYLESLLDAEILQWLFQWMSSGGQVLTTLPVFSSIASITRLLEIKQDPFLLASHLKLIVSQRLLRKLCAQCRQPCSLTELQKKTFPAPLHEDPRPVYRATGCAECQGTGYQGETRVYELLPISPRIQQQILTEASSSKIFQIAQEEGFQTLWSEALWKVLEGTTSLEEVINKVPKDPF